MSEEDITPEYETETTGKEETWEDYAKSKDFWKGFIKTFIIGFVIISVFIYIADTMIWCWDGYNIQNYRYLEPGNYTCLRCGDSIPNETVQKSCIYTNKPVAIVTDNWVLNHIMYPIGEIFTLNLLKINTTINATSPFKPFEKIKQGVPYEK